MSEKSKLFAVLTPSERRALAKSREARMIRDLFELYNVSDYKDEAREPEYGGAMDRLSSERPISAHRLG